MIDRNFNYGRHLIQRFLSRIVPYETVLDIGAGRGADLECARAVNPKATLLGLESFSPSVKELQQKNIQVFSTNIERDRFPFAAGSLDVVMGNQILEHTKEVFWILDQISTVLKDRGHLILGVPNLAALHNRLLLAFGRQPSPLKNSSAHVRGFTKGDMAQLLNSPFPGGYQLVDFGGSNFYPFPPFLAQPLARLFPTMAWGIFFLFQKVKPYRGEFLRYPVEQQLETNFFLG